MTHSHHHEGCCSSAPGGGEGRARLAHAVLAVGTLCWGAVLVGFYTTGLVKTYLAPSFHLFALVGGLAMIVLGLFNLLTIREPFGCGHCHHDEEGSEEAGHDHESQGPLVVVLLMILPIAVCVFATRHEYSPRALAWKGLYKQRSSTSNLFNIPREAFTREALDQSTTKTEDGHYRLQISELFWSSGDPEIMKVYQGLPAELEGRIIKEDDRLNPEGNRKRLYRVFMSCCAADAQVFGLAMQFEGPLPDLPDRSWVRVRGTVDYETVEGQDTAFLRVSSLESQAAPESQSPFLRGY